MLELKIKLKPYQDEYLFSEKRFPCLKAAIGTGKTMMLLLKLWRFCEDYPNSLALIVRKEFTDLKDSTMKDFERYFNVTVGSNKDYKFPNGSLIMFRHGAEINVLKNVNLSIVGIEQAEEFETDETFHFLRDRLRREGSPYRQLCLIANANGHNWIWRLWKNNKLSEDYHLLEANTFDNADNLPKDFIDDIKKMEQEAPNHYKQFVLNSDEDIEADDYVFNFNGINESINLSLPSSEGRKIISCDPARFGEDKTVFVIIENKGGPKWEELHIEAHKGKDLMWTVGRFIDLRREYNCNLSICDADGLGSGAIDRLREVGITIEEFHGGARAKGEEYFGNKRSEGFFEVKRLIDNGYIKLLDNPSQTDELLTIRYKYTSKGQKMIISKDDMRKNGIKSPDIADALMMAVSIVGRSEVREFTPQLSGKFY